MLLLALHHFGEHSDEATDGNQGQPAVKRCAGSQIVRQLPWRLWHAVSGRCSRLFSSSDWRVVSLPEFRRLSCRQGRAARAVSSTLASSQEDRSEGLYQGRRHLERRQSRDYTFRLGQAQSHRSARRSWIRRSYVALGQCAAKRWIFANGLLWKLWSWRIWSRYAW
jgi:hypothetical protein